MPVPSTATVRPPPSRAPMSRGVDTGGESRDDRETRARQVAGELERDAAAVLARATRADDGDTRLGHQRAADGQRERRIRDLAQEDRIGVVATLDDAGAVRVNGPKLPRGAPPCPDDGARHLLRDAGR